MENIKKNIVMLYEESDYNYIGMAIFPTTAKKTAFLTEWHEVKADWYNRLDWHEENDADHGDEWFRENDNLPELFENTASKHQGTYINFELIQFYGIDIAEV